MTINNKYLHTVYSHSIIRLPPYIGSPDPYLIRLACITDNQVFMIRQKRVAAASNDSAKYKKSIPVLIQQGILPLINKCIHYFGSPSAVCSSAQDPPFSSSAQKSGLRCFSETAHPSWTDRVSPARSHRESDCRKHSL